MVALPPICGIIRLVSGVNRHLLSAETRQEDKGAEQMKRLSLVSALLIACAVLCEAQSAYAQRRPPRVRSHSSPTLSPWLQLYRRDGGPLDNYHNFVRPEQQLRRTLDRHGTAIQRQKAGIRSLGNQVSTMQRGSSVRPTGAHGTFMNYSHYFGVGGGGGGGGSSRSWSPSSARSSGYGGSSSF